MSMSSSSRVRLLLVATLLQPSVSILPTAAIDIAIWNSNDNSMVVIDTLLASQASFGSAPMDYMERSSLQLVPAFPPANNAPLCQPLEAELVGVALIVARGECSFERKALHAQQAGASAIVVYGTLDSRYGTNHTNNMDNNMDTNLDTSNILWPLDKYDYDCNYGQAHIPNYELHRRGIWQDMLHHNNSTLDDYFGANDNHNLCVNYATAHDSNRFIDTCSSRRCLLTGNKQVHTENENNTLFQACCAWDLHVWMYADSSLRNETRDTNSTDYYDNTLVTIPAVYITMEQAAMLVRFLQNSTLTSGQETIRIQIYSRYVPKYNLSAVLIWALGVFVAWCASYRSSGEYRRAGKAVLKQREWTNGNIHGPTNTSNASNASNASNSSSQRSISSSMDTSNHTDSLAGYHPVGQTLTSENDATGPTLPHTRPDAILYPTTTLQEDPESLELTASHALGFILMASTSLLVLFFFKIYNVVKIMYAIGCSGALAQIVIHPGFTHICHAFQWKYPLHPLSCLTDENLTRTTHNHSFLGRCSLCLYECLGPITHIDIASMILSYTIGASWLYVAFSIPHPDTLVFYWVIQDIFGMCMCLLFLSTIKLNAIRVAAILLTVAFFYDIFFVFVTPLLTKHGESIMVNVATSGGPPKADPSWCEKYPSDGQCQGGDPLPMLFAIPRIGDYQGGCSMLGLGDIVLPGLLLSFASRYDEAKRLIGVVGGGSGRMRNNACPDLPSTVTKSTYSLLCFVCCCCKEGYFGPVMVAYAIGLAMANAAVYIMQMGQPALLYLVPCCLGTMVYMGYKSGELNDLWEGPRVIRSADALLYGGRVEQERRTLAINEEGRPLENQVQLT